MAKKFRIKNYKGNLVESIAKFQKSHEGMKVLESFEDELGLSIVAEPVPQEEEEETPQQSQETAAADPKSQAYGAIIPFGTKLLTFGVEVHLWHLNCSKHFQHIVLQDLYEACDDAGDKLVEAALGVVGGDATVFSATSSDTSVGAFDVGSAIAKIEAMQSEAAALVGSTDPGIDNVLSDFVEVCSSVLYKLKRFGD